MAENEQFQINEQICDKEVRVISSTGEQLGVMPAEKALKIAEMQGLDLVKISPNANPPVCKVIDYGKFKFENLKRQKEAKKNQKVVEMKEIWLSVTIDVGDLNVKAKQTLKFLSAGNKVKVSIRMHGRQLAHSELGLNVMDRFFEIVQDSASMEKKPMLEGKNILMVLAPLKK